MQEPLAVSACMAQGAQGTPLLTRFYARAWPQKWGHPLCPAGKALLCVAVGAVSLKLPAQQATAVQPSSPPGTPQVTDGTADSSGLIRGTVTDTQGAFMAGAQVQLQLANNPSPQVTVTGSDGTFVFPRLPAGSFTIRVTSAGFTAVSATGSLLPGQHFELQAVSLPLADVNITVDAVATPEELALEELRLEEHQRLLGMFPNFFVSYHWTAPPLSPKQKFTLAWRNAIDPGNLFLVGTTAGIQQADNAFPGYHQGAAGYGKRYGADLGNLVSGTFMGGAILPVLFRQDPRYFYKGTGTIRSRALYAISTAVICRGDNGHRQPAFASVLGDLSAGAISNLYYAPSDRQGATLTFENGLLGIAGDAMNNLFQEFVLRRLTSKSGGKSSEKP